MVDVSQQFRELALSNGREVYCRIEAGDEVFLDDRLLEFTLDDVTHPDWFTVGTACANRFHFAARFSGELPLGAAVKPYISFDNTEWCCLGEFSISRRYVRGDVIRITAYDRMYSLDMKYASKLSLPCSSSELLEELCAEHGIPLADSGYPYTVEALPTACTVRDMIGYIAGINRACAKFDRSGRLVLKKCTEYDEHISYLNCMDIQRNMAQSRIACLKAQTESEELVSGSSSELDTVEMYNPLMTQKILDEMYSMFKPFSYYGAEIEMQGLPYLESGESLYLLDGKHLYRIVTSEIELRYDGALTATIYSRNKTYIDAAVHEDDLEEALKDIGGSGGAYAYVSVNDKQIALGTAPRLIAEFDFKAEEGGFAQLDLNLSLSSDTADAAAFSVYINGVDSGRSIIHSLTAQGRHLLHIFHLQKGLRGGDNRIFITARTGNGDCYILPNALMAALVVHGAEEQQGTGSDCIRLFDGIDRITLIGFGVGLA
ncbi:MAG: hypothetical protein ACI4KA_08185 [Oscillospiraceae bacterium]